MSESLVNEALEEARPFMANDLTSAAGLEESLFDMSFTTTFKKPEKSPEEKYKVY